VVETGGWRAAPERGAKAALQIPSNDNAPGNCELRPVK